MVEQNRPDPSALVNPLRHHTENKEEGESYRGCRGDFIFLTTKDSFNNLV